MKAPEPLDLETFVPCPGITLIEASAGTGKTYSISNLVARWICEGRFNLSSLLILTFTEAATTELKERIRAELLARKERFSKEAGAEAGLRHVKAALAEFDQVSIHTIHGFCNRILKEYPYECGVPPQYEIRNDDEESRKAAQLQLFRIIQQGFASIPLMPLLIPRKKDFFDSIESAIQYIQAEAGHSLPDAPALMKELNSADQRIRDAMRIWKQDASMLRSVFLDKSRCPVNQRSYRILTTENAFDCFDAWASDRFKPFEKNKDALDHFSRSKLEKNLRKGASLPDSGFFDACESCLSLSSSIRRTIAGFRAHLEQARLTRQIHEHGQLRYDDLQRLLHKALQDPSNPLIPILRKRYQAAFIDEFQDTDPTQFGILSSIFQPDNPHPDTGKNGHPIVLIGDPKQAIYGFRGGDIFTYQSASQQAVRVLSLDTNWRSSPAINESVNRLIGSSPLPFGFDWIKGHPIQTAPQNQHLGLRFPSSPEMEGGLHLKILDPGTSSDKSGALKECAREIRDLLNIGPTLCPGADGPKTGRVITASDIAVLLPFNHDVAVLKGLLDKMGVPSMIHGGASVFESGEASDWLAVLTSIHRSPSSRWIRGALGSRLFGYNGTSLQELDEHPEKWDPVVVGFEQARSLWTNGNLPDALSMMSRRFEWKQRLVHGDQPERRLTNHLHLLDLILQYHETMHPTPDALIRWFEDRMANPDPRSDEEILRLEKQEDAIRLLTMHKAKGLEFPVVFIPIQPAEQKKKRSNKYPFIWHDDKGSRSVVVFSEDTSEEAEAAYYRETISEKARTQYVAITRAKVLCRAYLSTDGKSGSILESWIMGQPPDWENADSDSTNPETRLRARISELHCETHGAIRELESWGHASAEQTLMPFAADPAQQNGTLSYLEPREAPCVPAPRSFRSFSGMLRGVDHATDHDGLVDPLLIQDTDSTEATPSGRPSLHTFDKGTSVGNLFHAILERADFSDSTQWPHLIREHLETFGFDPSIWQSSFEELLNAIASSSLGGMVPPGTLSGRNPASLFREHEFTFPLNFDPEAIREIESRMRTSLPGILPGIPPYQIPFAPETSPTGHSCMRGFIDLWFEHEQRIYLVDWKSNWLGSQSDDYHPDAILNAMNTHHYHLQYLVYICALNRLLRAVHPGYDYSADFGGVAYVFLRGLNPRRPGASVFQTKPDPELVQSCERWLSW